MLLTACPAAAYPLQTEMRNAFRAEVYRQGTHPDTLMPDWWDTELAPSESCAGECTKPCM